MGTDTQRVIGYTRVSTEEQSVSGAGLAAQRATIEDECTRRGWHLVDVIEDAGYSGKNLDRPGMARALAMLDQRQAGGLVAAKVDRVSRSVLDFAGLLDHARRGRWALVVLDLGVDTSTPAGEMLAQVTAVIAQYERKLIGQRTRDGLAIKKAQGVILGRPQALPDELVARIVTAHRVGKGLAPIARMLEEEGVPTARGGTRWYASTIAGVLKSQAAQKV